MDDVKAKIDQRNRQLDAKAAARDADWVEDDAADAIDYPPARSTTHGWPCWTPSTPAPTQGP
jgi:hypothetical protein